MKIDKLNEKRKAPFWKQSSKWRFLFNRSLAFHLPDLDATTARLLRNATHMGNLLVPFYGNTIADMFSNLLTNHLVIAAEIVNAEKAGNQTTVADAKRRSYANDAEISKLLSPINPSILEKEFRAMFFEHLALTIREAILILQGNYEASIAVFDKIEAEALKMADTITIAIAKHLFRRF